MEDRRVSITITLILIIGIFTVVDFSMEMTRPVGAITITVDDSGGADYTTIQAAIAAANDGDTVFVYNGLYKENIYINKTINLIGEDRNHTIIKGEEGYSIVINIVSDWINVTRFKVESSGYSDSDMAIRTHNANNCTIIENNITTGGYGISISHSNNSILSNNIISVNERESIRLLNSRNVEISHTTMEDSGIHIWSNSIEYWNSHEIDSTNTVNGKPVYYLANEIGGVVPEDVGQVILANCSNIEVENLSIEQGYIGIYLGFSSFNNINGNSVTEAFWGIGLHYSNWNYLSNNSVTSCNQRGVYLEHSNNNTLFNNTASFNSDGFYIRYSNDNYLYNNTALNNHIDQGHGSSIAFQIYYSNRTEIIGNNASSDIGGGILLRESDENIIIQNKVKSNSESGIDIGYCEGAIISDNHMVMSGLSIRGHQISHWTSHDIDTSNLANGKPVYYWKNRTGGTIPSDAGVVILANCSDITVSKLEISNADVGIKVAFSNNIKIHNNAIKWSSQSISLYKSNESSIMGNDLYDNGQGLSLSSCHENEIISNNITWSDRYGISVYNSNYNVISENKASYSLYDGIILGGGFLNIIVNNTICDNNYGGIHLSQTSSNNISGNDVSYNHEYGIYLQNAWGNTIFHNNIIGNTLQAYDDMLNNSWNVSYPMGGNYWSDSSHTDKFHGPDQDLSGWDGICDREYDFDDIITDWYPLKKPWDRDNSVPSSPVGFNAIAGDSYTYLTWEYPKTDGDFLVMSYRIYIGNNSGEEVHFADLERDLHFNDTSVINGNTYYYRVSAVTLVGEGVQSHGVNATPKTVPNEPLNLTATSGDSFVTLNWNLPTTDGGSPIMNYHIFRGESPNEEDFLLEIGNVLTYDDINVTNGITYYYKVSATNELGIGTLSTEVNATPGAVSSAPSELTAKAGDSYIMLSWLAPLEDGGHPITNYIIYRSESSGVEEFLIEIGNVTSYKDVNIEQDTTYFYQISAKNTLGEGDLSKVVSASSTSDGSMVWLLIIIIISILIIGFVLIKWKRGHTQQPQSKENKPLPPPPSTMNEPPLPPPPPDLKK